MRHLLADGRVPFLLDVRNREDFEAWRIEGREALPAINIPYFEMLEAGGQDDVVDAVAWYAQNVLGASLPKTQPILAVCAKGETSAYVAQGLKRLGFDASSLAGGMAAWGNYCEMLPALEEPGLAILQVSRPARGCLSYVVASEGRAAVIDPLRHIAPYVEIARARGLRIDHVIDTHGHADHVSGGPALARLAGAHYHLHPYDAVHPIDLLPARIAFEHLRDGQEITVGRARLRALHIPGHTLGNVAFLVNDRALLAGDSIFIESISRPDLGGRGEAWAALHHRSLRALLELPPTTLVLPGHFSAPREARPDGVVGAALGDLARRNEGLRMAAAAEPDFVAYVLKSLPTFPERYVEMKRVNLGLTTPGEDDLSELELGKNACALAAADH